MVYSKSRVGFWGFFSNSAVVRLEINHGNGYRGNLTVYKKVIIYI